MVPGLFSRRSKSLVTLCPCPLKLFQMTQNISEYGHKARSLRRQQNREAWPHFSSTTSRKEKINHKQLKGKCKKTKQPLGWVFCFRCIYCISLIHGSALWYTHESSRRKGLTRNNHLPHARYFTYIIAYPPLRQEFESPLFWWERNAERLGHSGLGHSRIIRTVQWQSWDLKQPWLQTSGIFGFQFYST